MSERILADWDKAKKNGEPIPHHPASGSGADAHRTGRKEIEPEQSPTRPPGDPAEKDEGDYATERQPAR
ncbi:hypothetical protein [Amycolatopsis speibonae]|uniref:Uncharacterized protein n=1 Tax=Amycolatopsis speibonae TaxID=1450224 RepID=A0ABV7NNW0_9PSEU